MKTIAVIGAFISIFLFVGAAPKPATFISTQTFSKADDNGVFDFVKAHRQGKNGVTINWGCSSSYPLAFTIQRTYQDALDPYAYWEDVTMLPCTGARQYKYTDQNVFPGVISYRVLAAVGGGGDVVSEIRSIRIVSH